MPILNPGLLKNVPLFALLDDDEVSVLSEQLDQEQLYPGQLIFERGDPGGIMYVVQSGLVEIYLMDNNQEKVVLSKVEPGEIFGELSLLDNEPRSACAKAVEQTTLFVIDRTDLEILFNKHRAAALDIMAMLSKRVREADKLLAERVVSRNVNTEMTEKLTFSQRLADLFAAVAGDMRFFYASFIWFFVWIVWNLGLIPGLEPFDPYPFGLLTTIVSLEAIFLSTFLLISQNRQAEREKVRNDIEYDVNIKAELEVRELHQKMDALEALLVKHLVQVHTNIDKIQTNQNHNVRDIQ
jgi:CRP/FNR family transcriptional regulator, cyclic AMP receptor protein